MASVIYALVVGDTGGPGLPVRTDPIDGHVFVFDEANLPYVVHLTGKVPPPTGTLAVYDESGSAVQVALTPQVIAVDTLEAVSALRDVLLAPNPGTIAAAATTLQPALELQLTLAPAATNAAAGALSPTLVFGTLVVRQEDPLEAVSEALDPASAGPTTGAIVVDELDSPMGALEAAVRFLLLRLTPAASDAAASAITPTLLPGDLVVRLLGAPKCSMDALMPVLAFTNPNTKMPAVVAGALTAIAPAQLVFGQATVAIGIASASMHAIAPSSAGTGAPPTSPATTTGAAAALTPSLVGTGSRDMGTPGAAAIALTPTCDAGSRASAAPTLGAAAAALQPVLVGSGSSAPSVVAIAFVPLASAMSRGVPITNVAAAATALTPTLVRDLVIVVDVVSAACVVRIPRAETPRIEINVDVVDAQAGATQPDAAGCRGSVLVLAPAIASAGATAPRATRVIDFQPPTFELELDVVTRIDLTEEPDVTQQVQQNQEGAIFDLTMRDNAGKLMNLEGASEVYVWLRPPSGPSKRKSGQVLGEPSNGVVRYQSAMGDLHEHGMWGIQVSALLDGGERVWSAISTFRVEPNLGPHQPTFPNLRTGIAMEALTPSVVFS